MAEVNLLYAQVATIASLIGMALGWRGAMRDLHGFYDSNKAVQSLLWGFAFGAIASAALDVLVFVPYWELIIQQGSTLGWTIIVIVVLVAAGTSAVTLWRAANRKVREHHAAPAAGWAFGLGTGSMLAVRLGYRTLEINGGFSTTGMIQLVLIAITMPLLHSVIGCGLGARAQRKETALALFWATFAHTALIVLATYAIINPIGWILIMPCLMLGMRRADRVWLKESLHPVAARRLRRVRSKAARRAALSSVRANTGSDLSEE